MEKFTVYYCMEAETRYKQRLKHDSTFVGKMHKKTIRMLIVAINRGTWIMHNFSLFVLLCIFLLLCIFKHSSVNTLLTI